MLKMSLDDYRRDAERCEEEGGMMIGNELLDANGSLSHDDRE